MCEFCVKHGEGKKWYLQAKNYSDNLWNDAKRQQVARGHFKLIAAIPHREFKIYKFIYKRAPFLALRMMQLFKENFKKKHLGQVIPIEDVDNILSIVNSIVRIPCVCRKSTVGKELRYCFAMSINPQSIGMAEFVNKNYFDGPNFRQFERYDKEKALDFMKSLEPSGIIHSVWSVLTPFVAFICNCGYDGCIPMLGYKEITPILIKGEYVGQVDTHLCTKCGKCTKVCLYNAITCNISVGAVIDTRKCYGCGICRSVCEQNAIRLLDREKNDDTVKS